MEQGAPPIIPRVCVQALKLLLIGLLTAHLGGCGDGGKIGAGPDAGSVPDPTARPAFERIKAESFDGQQGITVSECHDDDDSRQCVAYIEQGDFLRFDKVDFGKGALGFEARVASLFDGAIIDIRIGSPDAEPVGRLLAAGTGDWQNWTTAATPITNVRGVHDVYLTFGDRFNFNWFRFTREIPERTPTVYDRIRKTEPLPAPVRDTRPDANEATDGLGRPLPAVEETGAPRGDKFVGVFYFLVHGDDARTIYDIGKLLMEKPGAAPSLGPVGEPHYWAEPYLGYYHSEDPFVIRKHAQMLFDAGVDTLVLDVSNGVTYPRAVIAIFEEFAKMRREGLPTPRIAFHSGEDVSNCATTVTKLYELLYSRGYYPELWFRWKDRPLIFGNMQAVPESIRDFFTVRRSWAWSAGPWFGGGRDAWPWIDHLPQRYGWHENPAKAEGVSVAIAEHPIMGVGRSSTSSATPQPSGSFPSIDISAKGIFFDLQWKRALEVDPEFVFITGWNEWVAGHYKTAPGQRVFFLDRALEEAGSSFFVDSYNPEFSRDAEPMRGGFGDAYYYQMAANIRRFKGARAAPSASGQKEIAINLDFAQWDDVGPEYLDDAGDTARRDFKGFGKANHYTNTSGRNDIISCKVSAAGESVAFLARTATDLTDPMSNWMVLYLDTDNNPRTGWGGFDHAVNRAAAGSLEKWAGGWQHAGDVPWAVLGNQLHLVVAAAIFTAKPADGFLFKWADNSTPGGEPIEWTAHGDAAPNARFSWRFRPAAGEVR
jgi:hypothetical protein